MAEATKLTKFPDDFLWGATTAAHQIEGGNTNDWSQWEKQNADRLAAEAGPDVDYGNGSGTLPSWELIEAEATDPANYISGDAVGSYERWRDDVDMASDLDLNALRFSVEWSRVQPTEAGVDTAALDHYAEMTAYCLESGISPLVSLHHFTNPTWISEKGGWEDKEIVRPFTEYVEMVTEVMPEEGVRYVVLNEPNVYASLGWIAGMWPPGKHNPYQYRKVKKNLIAAHNRSYDAIKETTDDAEVSSAVNYTHFDPKPGFPNKALANLGRKWVNEWFQDGTIDQQDFLAINHYMHCVVDKGIFKNDPSEPRSDLGWYLNPDSLLQVLREAGVLGKPIVITENGLADSQDKQRAWFLRESLKAVQQAITEGVDVQGYLHWSLMDNFEWDKGYWPKFGLASVDLETMERTLRPSSQVYKGIIEAGTAE